MIANIINTGNLFCVTFDPIIEYIPLKMGRNQGHFSVLLKSELFRSVLLFNPPYMTRNNFLVDFCQFSNYESTFILITYIISLLNFS